MLPRIIVIASLLFASSVWASSDVNLQFFTHIQMKVPEQDVFIQSLQNPLNVVRVDADEATSSESLKKIVYSAATSVGQDMFKTGTKPLGPFEKGKSLGFTLGDWLAASGSGTYAINDDKIDMSLLFEKLVPNGLYTVWCSRVTLPPNVSIVYKLCGELGSTQNFFTADNLGNGTIHIK